MKSRNVKILALLATLGGVTMLSVPATALPGLDRDLGATPMIEKAGCGPYGCGGWGGGGWGGGYGYGPRPQLWGYGYGWRPRPWGWGHRHWGGGWGGGWGPRW